MNIRRRGSDIIKKVISGIEELDDEQVNKGDIIKWLEELYAEEWVRDELAVAVNSHQKCKVAKALLENREVGLNVIELGEKLGLHPGRVSYVIRINLIKLVMLMGGSMNTTVDILGSKGNKYCFVPEYEKYVREHIEKYFGDKDGCM